MFERLSTLYMMIVGDYNGNEGVITKSDFDFVISSSSFVIIK